MKNSLYYLYEKDPNPKTPYCRAWGVTWRFCERCAVGRTCSSEKLRLDPRTTAVETKCLNLVNTCRRSLEDPSLSLNSTFSEPAEPPKQTSLRADATHNHRVTTATVYINASENAWLYLHSCTYA